MAEARRGGRLDQPRDLRRLALPRVNPEAFGQWSEAIARFMGTARFLVYMTVVIAMWIAWNALAPQQWRVDPYTFTFLTLMLSLQASYAAPLILLAQNRQTDRDRLVMEEDRRRAQMQKADTEYLAREIAALRIALGDVATRDFLRSELTRLTDDLDEAAHRRHKSDRKEQRKEIKRAARRAVEATGSDDDEYLAEPDEADAPDPAVADAPDPAVADEPHAEGTGASHRAEPDGAHRGPGHGPRPATMRSPEPERGPPDRTGRHRPAGR